MKMIFSALLGMILMIAAPAPSLADASGPDFFRVVDVAADDVLNIRAAASASSDKIGSIPHDADGIRNMGCEGGMSYAQWAQASKAEREAASHRRWCRISYKGVEGWAAGRFLGEGSTPRKAALSPSFDCARAEGAAEQGICADPRLTRLDNELARLYHLAVNGPNMTPERLQPLKEMQRGWIKGRDDCWKADQGLNACIADRYAARIDEIRTGYFDARQDDGAGISSGPFAYDCDGLAAGLSVSIIAADPAILSLRWRDFWITPVGVPAGSGSKFEALTLDGRYEFWSKGDEASFSLPDGSVLACKQGDIG